MGSQHQGFCFFTPQTFFALPCCCGLSCHLSCCTCSKRAFIVTDPPLFEMGITNQLVNKLLPLGIQCKTFTNVEPDPTLAMVER